MNINDASAIRDCTSCQVCGAVCPTSAINIVLNEDGFYRPVVDAEKCVDCGLCVKSCYKFDHGIRSGAIRDSYKLYASWAKDEHIVESTTSGGIADVMARYLVNHGYKCIGVRYDHSHNRAEGCVAATVDETAQFRGSKYIQSLSVTAFKELVNNYRKEKYAVFGLPCQIYAIDRFLHNKGCRENHLLIDLFCHGCPSLHLWNKYTKKILLQYNGKNINAATFRSKARGWGNYNLVIEIESTDDYIQVVSPRINDSFYDIFFSDMVLNDSCYSCAFRSTFEYADVRLGDFWGHSYVKNHKGVSGICIISKHGKRIVEAIADKLIIKPQEFSNFLPYQSYGKKYVIDFAQRKILLNMLADRDSTIDNVVHRYVKYIGLKLRLVRFAKNIVKLMPNNLISTAKASYYKLKKK